MPDGLEAQPITNLVKQKATDAYTAATQQIIEPLDIATQEYVTAPKVAREKYAGIFDPFAREKLVSQYTSQQALPMMGLSSLLGGMQSQRQWEMEMEQRERLAKKTGAGGFSPWQMYSVFKDILGEQPKLAAQETKVVREGKELIDRINEIQAGLGKERGWLQDIFAGVTGPLAARVLPEYRAGKEVRSDINKLQTDLQHAMYGAVLSRFEMKDYPRWGVSAKFQETANWNRLEAMKREAMSQIWSAMSISGYQGPQIEEYLETGEMPQQMGIESMFGQLMPEYGEWEIVE